MGVDTLVVGVGERGREVPVQDGDRPAPVGVVVVGEPDVPAVDGDPGSVYVEAVGPGPLVVAGSGLVWEGREPTVTETLSVWTEQNVTVLTVTEEERFGVKGEDVLPIPIVSGESTLLRISQTHVSRVVYGRESSTKHL